MSRCYRYRAYILFQILEDYHSPYYITIFKECVNGEDPKEMINKIISKKMRKKYTPFKKNKRKKVTP